MIHESGVLERGQSYSCILGALIYGGIRRQKKKGDKGQSPEVLREVQGELTSPAAPGVLIMQRKTSIRPGLMASEVIRREMLSVNWT